MSVPPLQTICIRRTCGFLESGVWHDCEENPFSFMPLSVVQNLWSCMLSARSKLNEGWTVHSQQLLTSGRLQHVNMENSRRLCAPHHAHLFLMLSLSCRHLRTLSLPRCDPPVLNLPELLQNCTNLEELRSPFPFDLYHLRNCKKLRSLKLYLDYHPTMKLVSYISLDRLQQLTSLEVFAFPTRILPKREDDKYRLIEAAVQILDTCHKLSSLGYFDSLMAISMICRRDRRALKASSHFELKRCYWRTSRDMSLSVCCDAIRDAAMSCTLLEVLEIHVSYAGSLKHLKVLKYLTDLVINFYDCADEYELALYDLLNEMGHQLHTLSISGRRVNPCKYNWARDNWNEDTPHVLCEMRSKEPSVKLLGLKRLAVFECNHNINFFLLSNSIHLKNLRLRNCLALGDNLLNEILRTNSFSELESVDAFECSLPSTGLEKFVKSAVNLRSLSSVSSPSIDSNEVEQCLRLVNPSLLIRREYKPMWHIKMY